MPDEQNVDIVSKTLEAIPESAWVVLAKTTATTFSEVVRPITATLGGVGRLIEQKFKNKGEIEQIFFADAVKRAKEKADASSRSMAPNQNPDTLCLILDRVCQVNESLTREMWINLLARDLTGEEVHPEFVNILGRLSPKDARLFAEIAEMSDANRSAAAGRELMRRVRSAGIEGQISFNHLRLFNRKAPFDISVAVLTSLNLIEIRSGLKCLTEFGERFAAAVVEPQGLAGEPGTSTPVGENTAPDK